MYLKINLPTRLPTGEDAGPLPGWLAALNLSPAELADLTDRGYPDIGYLLIVDVPLPTPLPGHVVERDGWVIGETTANPRWGMRALTDDERAADLAARRTDKITAINAERDRRYAVGFLFEGNVYQIDGESRTDMLAVEAKLNRGEVSPHGGFWRSAANIMVPMDDAKVASFIGASGNYVRAIKAWSWALKDAVLVSGDPATIDVMTGLPD